MMNNKKTIMLIQCVERDMNEPQFFETHEQAHDVMCSQLADVMGIDVEEVKTAYEENEDYEDGVGVTTNMAWAERFGNCYDWKIFNLATIGVEK